MYIKFKVEDNEIELGGLDHTFDVEPLLIATVSAVTNILESGKAKKLRDAIERFDEDDDSEKSVANNNRTGPWTNYCTTHK